MQADITLAALLMTAFLTAVIHTLAGPDHYLPFIAIAKSRGYGLARTLLWTFVCGIGHIASALLIAYVFVRFSHILTEERLETLELNRSNLAAWLMVAFGGASMIYAMRRRIRHAHAHDHGISHLHASWIIFIILVLGPCEALLPLLAASSVLGTPAIISVTLLFSLATIATMMTAVAAGLKGLDALKSDRFSKFEKYAHEITGGIVMACGLGVLFLGW